MNTLKNLNAALALIVRARDLIDAADPDCLLASSATAYMLVEDVEIDIARIESGDA